jgi:hypothetical protein
MGSPILLGGMEFRVPATSLVGSRAEARGLAILSEVGAALKTGGYEPAKPKRGKIDDVRLRCLHRLGYIDLILVFERTASEPLAFSLNSWGYTRYHNDAVYKELKAVWRNMSQLIDILIRHQFSSPAIRTLTPAEVDARYAAKSRS